MSTPTPSSAAPGAGEAGGSETGGSETGASETGAGETGDGRSRRWDVHRAARRRELVDAALRAIRIHGAGVGMDDIAAVAETSKTVLYRHFTDRAGLYAAVAQRVDENILRDVSAAADVEMGGRPVIGAAIAAYLQMVEDEPEIYRFVVTAPILERPTTGDPSGPVSAHIAEQIGEMLGDVLDAESDAATPMRSRLWARGVVGMVRAAADEWLTHGGAASGVSRAELAAMLTELAWSGLSPSPAADGPRRA